MLMAMAVSKDLDMSAHLECLVRVFTDHTPGSPLSAYCSEIATYGSVHKIWYLPHHQAMKDQGYFWSMKMGQWSMKMGQWPMSHSFACKNQDFDGSFEILMGHLEKLMSPRNLNIHLTAK